MVDKHEPLPQLEDIDRATLTAYKNMLFEKSKQYPASVTTLGAFTAQFLSDHPHVHVSQLKNSMLSDQRNLETIANAVNSLHARHVPESQAKPRLISVDDVRDILEGTFDAADLLHTRYRTKEAIARVIAEIENRLYAKYREMKGMGINKDYVEQLFLRHILRNASEPVNWDAIYS